MTLQTLTLATCLALTGLTGPALADGGSNFQTTIQTAIAKGTLGAPVDGYYEIVMIPMDPDQNVAGKLYGRTLLVPEDLVIELAGGLVGPPKAGQPIGLSELIGTATEQGGCAWVDPWSAHDMGVETGVSGGGIIVDFWSGSAKGSDPSMWGLIDDISGYGGIFGSLATESQDGGTPMPVTPGDTKQQEGAEEVDSPMDFGLLLALTNDGKVHVGAEVFGYGGTTNDLPSGGGGSGPSQALTPQQVQQFQMELQAAKETAEKEAQKEDAAKQDASKDTTTPVEGDTACPDGQADCEQSSESDTADPTSTESRPADDPDVDPTGGASDEVLDALEQAFKEGILGLGPSWTDPAPEQVGQGPVVLACFAQGPVGLALSGCDPTVTDYPEDHPCHTGAVAGFGGLDLLTKQDLVTDPPNNLGGALVTMRTVIGATAE